MRLLTSRSGVRASPWERYGFCCVDALSLRAIALGPPAQSMPPGLPPGASRPASRPAPRPAPTPASRPPARPPARPASRPPARPASACLGAWVGGGCFFFAEQDNFKPQRLPTASGVSSSSWAGPVSSSRLQHRKHGRHCSHFGSRYTLGSCCKAGLLYFSMSQTSKTHSFHLDNHLLCLVPKLVTTRCSAPVAA